MPCPGEEETPVQTTTTEAPEVISVANEWVEFGDFLQYRLSTTQVTHDTCSNICTAMAPDATHASMTNIEEFNFVRDHLLQDDNPVFVAATRDESGSWMWGIDGNPFGPVDADFWDTTNGAPWANGYDYAVFRKGRGLDNVSQEKIFDGTDADGNVRYLHEEYKCLCERFLSIN